MYNMKRSRQDQLNEYVCCLIEDGNLPQLQKIIPRISIDTIRPPCGSHLMALAPCVEIADVLIDAGLEMEDTTGRLLASCYDPVAKYLVYRNMSIQTSLNHIQVIMPILSPNSQRLTSKRKQELVEWKNTSNHYIRNVLIEDCHLIRDLTTIILPYLE